MGESYLKSILHKELDKRRIPNWAAAAGPYHPTGIADRIGCLPGGRMLWIECKNPNGKGKTRKQQKSRADEFAAMGALVIISCNLREILMLVDSYLETTKGEVCFTSDHQPSMHAC